MKKLLAILFISTLTSIASFGQNSIAETWKTENNNTLIKIEKKNDAYIGKIISSDDKKATIGMQIIKDVKFNNGKWEGYIYAPKREKWYDIELSPDENILQIIVSAGFISKTIEWTKH